MEPSSPSITVMPISSRVAERGASAPSPHPSCTAAAIDKCRYYILFLPYKSTEKIRPHGTSSSHVMLIYYFYWLSVSFIQFTRKDSGQFISEWLFDFFIIRQGTFFLIVIASLVSAEYT